MFKAMQTFSSEVVAASEVLLLDDEVISYNVSGKKICSVKLMGIFSKFSLLFKTEFCIHIKKSQLNVVYVFLFSHSVEHPLE